MVVEEELEREGVGKGSTTKREVRREDKEGVERLVLSWCCCWEGLEAVEEREMVVVELVLNEEGPPVVGDLGEEVKEGMGGSRESKEDREGAEELDLGKKESSEAGMRRRERIRSLEGGAGAEGEEEDGMTKEVGIGERRGGGDDVGKEEEEV